MAKYKLKYDDTEVLRKINHEVETYGDLTEVLKEFTIFLQAITYSSYGLVNTLNKNEYIAVTDFLNKYRTDKENG